MLTGNAASITTVVRPPRRATAASPASALRRVSHKTDQTTTKRAMTTIVHEELRSKKASAYTKFERLDVCTGTL